MLVEAVGRRRAGAVNVTHGRLILLTLLGVLGDQFLQHEAVLRNDLHAELTKTRCRTGLNVASPSIWATTTNCPSENSNL